MTNLSRSKIQCWKSAKFYTYNWSIVWKLRRPLLSYNLAFRRSSTSTSGRIFLFNFPCQRSSLDMKYSVVSDSIRKIVISDSSSKFATCIVLKGQTRCSKDYDSPQGRFKGQIDDFPRVTGLFSIQARPRAILYCPPCFCFIFRASRRPITRVKFKFVARQVVASVVIRAAKLEFCCRK